MLTTALVAPLARGRASTNDVDNCVLLSSLDRKTRQIEAIRGRSGPDSDCEYLILGGCGRLFFLAIGIDVERPRATFHDFTVDDHFFDPFQTG